MNSKVEKRGNQVRGQGVDPHCSTLVGNQGTKAPAQNESKVLKLVTFNIFFQIVILDF